MSGPVPGRFALLDRDGVLNRRPTATRYVTSPRELELLPRTLEGLACLASGGYEIVVVTNQQGVALGYLTEAELAGVNAEVRRLVAPAAALRDILVCPHADGAGCSCRKPRPGLLLEAARRYGLSLPRTFFVGDQSTDVEAGLAAGVRTIYVGAPGELEGQEPEFVATDLLDAARIILREDGLAPENA